MKNLFSIGLCAAFLVCASFASPILAQSPTDNATTPTTDAAEVVSVYGDSYTSIANNLSPDWAQSGSVNPAFDPGTGDLVMLYANFNYQGTELATTDASAMSYLHVDVWVAPGTDRLLKVTPVNNAAGGSGVVEFLVNVPLTPGSWNSVDLPKSAFTGMTWDNVFQMKFDGQFNGNGTANGAGYDVYLDNIYFWEDTSAPVSGCMDSNATNYVAEATVDDGTCTYNVTFRVDMANFTGASYGGVFINGTFNSWCGTCNPLADADQDGVWEVTLPLTAGTIEYKFTLDGWTQQEEFLPGGSCTVTNNGFANRALTIDGVEDLSVVCWNTCAACLLAPGCMDSNAVNYDSSAQADDGSCLYAVTFQVDMSNYGLADGATVYTNGTYNGWCGACNPMTNAGNGLWTGTFNLPAGDQEYKFTINGWESDEQFNGNEACTTAPAEFVNRVTNISGPTTLPVVCWNTCDACADITNTTLGTGHSTIQDAIDAASAGNVIEILDGSHAIATPILVNKAVTLQGQSEAGTVLTCEAALGGANSIQVTAGATLKDFTLEANSYATFGIHVQPGTDGSALSGLTINNTGSNGIGLSGVTNATVNDIAGSGNVQYILGIAGSVGVSASDISGGNVGVYKGTGTYAQSATDIVFTGTFNLAGGFIIEQLAGADEITYSINGDPADVQIPASFDRVFFANYTSVPLPPPYNEAHLATLVEAGNLATAIGTAQALDAYGYGLEGAAVYNLTADQWEVSTGLAIQDAIDRAEAGDVIDVAAGTYAEALTLNQGATLNGNGSTLDVSGLGVGISIASDVDGVTIDNLTIVGDASTYSGITVNPGASNVSLLNNDISGMALSNPGNSSPLSYGILCWGNTDPINPPSNILIDGNEIHGVSGTAISLGDNTEGLTISNNHFHTISQVLVNGAPWTSGVVAGQANNLAITGNNMEGLGYASVLTACTGVSLAANQYTGGTSLMLLASLPNSILPDATDWWSLEAAAIGYIYYFNSEAAQAATDAGLQAVGIPTVLSSSNPGCMEADACNFDSTALSEDGSCSYPPATYFDCNGVCENDADGDGICDELEGLIPELETACGANTVWDPVLGQCIMNAECIGDVDLDGHIGSTDLLYLLGNFGTFCQDNGGE
jgi:hypothetical protein